MAPATGPAPHMAPPPTSCFIPMPNGERSRRQLLLSSDMSIQTASLSSTIVQLRVPVESCCQSAELSPSGFIHEAPEALDRAPRPPVSEERKHTSKNTNVTVLLQLLGEELLHQELLVEELLVEELLVEELLVEELLVEELLLEELLVEELLLEELLVEELLAPSDRRNEFTTTTRFKHYATRPHDIGLKPPRRSVS
ncbi:hypothetical protein EYF80_053412 [Liparis tanakae]|uniref:Uncharacterized protein n=1 Tax=Liparis tanakae TaxID=230148 RepID=A0A4Z2F5T3_9TELE|nr:hypothetical protein EYF80_053412 [Liparis tanakae]